MRLHHVQVSCPPGGEDDARRFYGDGLGLTEVAKPPALAGRGGCWFRSYDDRGEVVAEIHVGVEPSWSGGNRPADELKAHPALAVGDVAALDELAVRLRGVGFVVDTVERETFEGYLRFHTRDAAGNRVELLAPDLRG